MNIGHCDILLARPAIHRCVLGCYIGLLIRISVLSVVSAQVSIKMASLHRLAIFMAALSVCSFPAGQFIPIT